MGALEVQGIMFFSTIEKKMNIINWKQIFCTQHNGISN
jgi:hypothetical protein